LQKLGGLKFQYLFNGESLVIIVKGHVKNEWYIYHSQIIEIDNTNFSDVRVILTFIANADFTGYLLNADLLFLPTLVL
jgi:hypothetical protein